jgi:hypothetical protein
MNVTLVDIFLLPLIILSVIGLVILAGLSVDWLIKFFDIIKSFDIVDIEIKTIEKDKFLMRFTNPVIFYGGCVWTFLGFVILILRQLISFDFNGLTIIGIGLTVILYSFTVKVILDDDLSFNVLLNKTRKPLPKPLITPNYNKLFRAQYPKMKFFLYSTVGLALVAVILIPASLFTDFSFFDTVGVSIIFLTAAGAFNQFFMNKYEKFILSMEIDRLLIIIPD